MKKILLFLTVVVFCHYGNAQKNYSELITEAKIYEQDSTQQRQALNSYLKAFRNYKDSITENDQYWFTVLAASLKENDLAFEYLIPLAKLEKDEYGFPGWDLIAGEYSEEDYGNLFEDERWKELKKHAIIEKQEFFDDLSKKQKEFFKSKKIDFSQIQKPRKLVDFLSNFNPYLPKKDRNYSISFSINDSTKTSYLIHLPKNYNPEKKYPLLFFLHGAVRGNTLQKYQTPELVLQYWNRFYTKFADQEEVILVFPSGNKKYNWMSPDDGFFMVLEILKEIKSAINVHDNKVYISGHSNGATGSFSYLMKAPTHFAGFYGFNTYPKVFTGGTFVENAENRNFINFSTDKDYYYPPGANDKLDSLMKKLKIDYKDFRYNGFPHWFPQFDESEKAVKILFEDLAMRVRNPFPKKLNWEFDDNSYGKIDWLTHIKLDTLRSKKELQQTHNFEIEKWLQYNKNDSLVLIDVHKKAFDFPRKSGKITAEYTQNTFFIETSRIKSFNIQISGEMVNLKEKVKVYLNGKLYVEQKIKHDRAYILKNFTEQHDRNQLWVNYIHVEL